MNRAVVLSGCSGGGKSSLAAELRRRGHAVVEEPGRRIVDEESARGGSALPWIDMRAFLRRAIFEVATNEYTRLLAAYAALGDETIVLPKTGVAERADCVLAVLRLDG